jgi:hypothetical protein
VMPPQQRNVIGAGTAESRERITDRMRLLRSGQYVQTVLIVVAVVTRGRRRLAAGRLGLAEAAPVQLLTAAAAEAATAAQRCDPLPPAPHGTPEVLGHEPVTQDGTVSLFVHLQRHLTGHCQNVQYANEVVRVVMFTCK